MPIGLSVVVVAHDMDRELPRTLVSLCPEYQRGIGVDEYEVIVVDNASPPSPARAMNIGLSLAQGALIGAMIGGAHLATPIMLRYARVGSQLAQRVVVLPADWDLVRRRLVSAQDRPAGG